MFSLALKSDRVNLLERVGPKKIGNLLTLIYKIIFIRRTASKEKLGRAWH